MIEVISWNVNKRPLWTELTDGHVDIALLQECPRPNDPRLLEAVPSVEGAWSTRGWTTELRTCILRLTDRLQLRPHGLRDPEDDSDVAALGVSRRGTIAVADVLRDGEFLFTVASVYGAWERPQGSNLLYADASVHRILSDLSPLLTGRRNERLLITGDLNILNGYGEHGSEYWGSRYQSVFDRALSLGLVFAGPQAPAGTQADPWPSELPAASRDVPTFHHSRQRPGTATRQLDFVFATRNIADRITTRALNGPAEWGHSDHCRIGISIDL
jgi:hypothetical protein